MAAPTRSASRSAPLGLSKDSHLLMSSWPAAFCTVVSATAITITVSDASQFGGTNGQGIYGTAAGKARGMVQVVTSAAANTNHGKTANITGISGTAITVDADLSTALAAGDTIAVIPPLSSEPFVSTHSLHANLNNDYSMELNAVGPTVNTPDTVDVSGDVEFYVTPNSEVFVRALAYAFGTFKYAAGTPSVYTYQPIVNVASLATDGTTGQTAMPDATFVALDGKSSSNKTAAIARVFGGNYPTKTVISFPENGLATMRVSNRGNLAIREVGGSGLTWQTGASKWYDTAVLTNDRGTRITGRSCFVDLGGSFNDVVSNAPLGTVKNMTVTIDRGDLNDRVLGSAYILKPEETLFRVSVDGTLYLQDNTIQLYADGQATDADPGNVGPGSSNGFKTTTRLLLAAVLPGDATKQVIIDIPNGVFESVPATRNAQRRIELNFTYQAIFTLSSGAVSTSTPFIQVKVLSSVAKNLATAV